MVGSVSINAHTIGEQFDVNIFVEIYYTYYFNRWTVYCQYFFVYFVNR